MNSIENLKLTRILLPLLKGSLKIACGLCFIIQQQEQMLRSKSNQLLKSMQIIGKRRRDNELTKGSLHCPLLGLGQY